MLESGLKVDIVQLQLITNYYTVGTIEAKRL